MPTTDQVKALLRCHLDGDEDRFYAVAMQVAAQAARQGHARVATELRRMVDAAQARAPAGAPAGPLSIAQPRGELVGLLAASSPALRLSDMVLDAGVRARLRRVVAEQRQQHKLRAHGLEPRRKLLLLGPPGTGKTMTASALAGELHLPLLTTLLDGLITKFMGETAAKLRLVFDAMARTRGVFLFDEFDAIAGRRAAANDVGEVRRILNSFLQFVEQDGSASLIVAATNHPDLLDPAVFRRFDDVIEYDLPSDDIIIDAMRSRLALLSTAGVDWTAAVEAARGLSHSDVVSAATDAAKEAILADRAAVDTEGLVRALGERRARRA
ncbi:MAG: ATP-binding protein [Deltaproteobacteria bacterium]|nr:ATP-binding protein [Deltaproteobacteria bacterium]